MVRYIIIKRGVYEASFQEMDIGPAHLRADFEVIVTNVEDPSESHRAVVGVSRQLYDDYPSYNVPVPLRLLVLRHFAYHLDSDRISEIFTPRRPSLDRSNYSDYLGLEIADHEVADITIRSKFTDAVRAKADIKISIGDLFISTDLKMETIRRSLNYLVAADELEEIDELYQAKPPLLSRMGITIDSLSLDDEKEWDVFICHASED